MTVRAYRVKREGKNREPDSGPIVSCFRHPVGFAPYDRRLLSQPNRQVSPVRGAPPLRLR